MLSSTHHSVLDSNELLPAWLFSILFHSCLMALLALGVQNGQRRAAQQTMHSAGLVLMSMSVDDGTYDSGDQQEKDRFVAARIQDIASALPNSADGADFQKRLPTPPIGRFAALSGGAQEDAGLFPDRGQQSGSPGGTGLGARVSVFGVEGTGTKFVYLFDRSASMEGPPLAAAKRQLTESLKSLEGVHQFHIIFFNTRTRSLNVSAGGRRIAFANDRNKQLAAKFVRGITADGGTDRLVALREAISFSPDVIFFLTDADDPMPASELADIERWNRRANAAICVIEFGRGATPPGKNFLTELAAQSGGQYGYVNVAELPR